MPPAHSLSWGPTSMNGRQEGNGDVARRVPLRKGQCDQLCGGAGLSDRNDNIRPPAQLVGHRDPSLGGW